MGEPMLLWFEDTLYALHLEAPDPVDIIMNKYWTLFAVVIELLSPDGRCCCRCFMQNLLPPI